MFADQTGIVHISGVSDPNVGVSEMHDDLRILVDEDDRIGTIAQIEAMIEAGYEGPISFECFAPSVHRFANPGQEIARSFDFIESHLSQLAA